MEAMLFDDQDIPEKGKGKQKSQKSQKSKSTISDESDGYASSGIDGSLPNVSDGDDSDSAYGVVQELRALAQTAEKKQKSQTNGQPQNKNNVTSNRPSAHFLGQTDDTDLCSMCGMDHNGAECYMTASSEHLVEYRRILMDPECGDIEPRVCCIHQALYKGLIWPF